MAVQSRIKPSPEARKLFNQMVNRADTNLHISLTDSLDLAIERNSPTRDRAEVRELEEEEWIDEAPDGGWLLH